MFFRLTNSPATFQTMMNHIFKDLITGGFVTVYMDDILIHTPPDLPLHRRLVIQVLTVLLDNDLYLRPEKCLFEVCTVEYLGIVLEGGQLRMDLAKVEAILAWPPPKNVQGVRAFIGFCLFYR